MSLLVALLAGCGPEAGEGVTGATGAGANGGVHEAVGLDAAGVAALRARLDVLAEAQRACEATWRAVVTREALVGLAPGEEPCPIALAPPTVEAAERFVREGFEGEGFGAWTLTRVPPGAAVGSGGGCDRLGWRIGQLRKELAEGEATADTLARAGAEEAGGYEVLLLVEPGAPGTLGGRAYLYDQGARRFLCGGSIAVDAPAHATAPPPIRARALEVAARRAIVGGLRRVE